MPTWAQVLDQIAADKARVPESDATIQAARDLCKACTASWADCTISIEGSAPVDVSQKKLPDHTLEEDDQDHRHRCLIAQTEEAVSRLTLTTEVRPEGPVAGKT